MVYEQYWKARNSTLLPQEERLRQSAIALRLSREARHRLEWFIFYESKGERIVSLTCRHFGIGRSLFYKWKARFDEAHLQTLENVSQSPRSKRKRVSSSLKDGRIIALRKHYPAYGKEKVRVLYERLYGETITSWYIQRVIETYHLQRRKKQRKSYKEHGKAKKKVTDLEKKPYNGFLIHLDSIVLYRNNLKRYIITAIDEHSRIAYARMYTSHTSMGAKDFFQRLHYLLEGDILNVHTDNGSEFHKHFEEALQKLNLSHWWSRPRTPKDNPKNERFNRTLKEEFLRYGNFTPDTRVFNRKLTEWLVEYNSVRPHQSLGYQTPLAFAKKQRDLSTMYSSSTPR
ncbi:MAG: integrase core domain-containing protein [Chromatiaceae bacterium]